MEKYVKTKNFIDFLMNEKILNFNEFIKIKILQNDNIKLYNSIIYNIKKNHYIEELHHLKNINNEIFFLLDEPFTKYLNYCNLICKKDISNKKFVNLKDFQLNYENYLWKLYLLTNYNKEFADKNIKEYIFENLYNLSNIELKNSKFKKYKILGK